MSHTDFYALIVDRYPSDMVLRCACGWAIIADTDADASALYAGHLEAAERRRSEIAE